MPATANVAKNPWLGSSQALGVNPLSALMLNGHGIKLSSKFMGLSP